MEKRWSQRLLSMLLTLIMLMGCLPLGVSAKDSDLSQFQVIFQEDFESGLSRWTSGHGTPTVAQSPNSTRGMSYHVNEDADTIYYTFEQTQSAIAEVWLYDSGDSGQFRAMISVDDGKDQAIRSAGIHMQKSKDHYVVRVAGEWIVTEVPRTKGWHQFVFDYSGQDSLTISIDGTVVKGGIPSPDGFSRIYFGDPGTNERYVSNTYFDDVTVKVPVVDEREHISGIVKLSGRAETGAVLTADCSNVRPAEAQDGLSFQWYRDGSAIPGASDPKYTLTQEDVGCQIKAVVTAGEGYQGELTSYFVTVFEVPEDQAVVPVDWSRFEQGLPADENAVLLGKILQKSLSFGFTTWWEEKGYDTQEGQQYLNFGGKMEKHIRPPAMEAFAMAIALRTGLYDESIVRIDREDAMEMEVRLISSLAYHHAANDPNGWGGSKNGNWQSTLWAYYTGYAAWLLWDELDLSTQEYARRMVEAEANRKIPVDYYRDADGTIIRRGNTAAEENGWNAALMQLAICMMPDHPNQAAWQEQCLTLMITSTAKPSDLQNTNLLHGRPVKDWLNGSNINEDGTAVNHSRIHPDYMLMINHPNAAYIYTLAGKPTPLAATFNMDDIYYSLTDLEFPAGPGYPFENGTTTIREPGGTIYQQDGHIYFPMGNDWGDFRTGNYVSFDAAIGCLGLDTRSQLSAFHYENLHLVRLDGLQSRFDDTEYGKIYHEDEFHYGSGSDTETSEISFLARAYMMHWITNQQEITFDNSAPAAQPAGPVEEDFTEDFENGFAQWEVYGGTPDSVQIDEAHGSSYVIDEDYDNIIHRFRSPQSGIVTVELYDPMEEGTYRGMIQLSEGTIQSAGINTAVSKDYYMVRIGTKSFPHRRLAARDGTRLNSTILLEMV
ncbi:hypothetical protein [uncultured Flavonifractor sp.]|uniref:hypothetical protein n=1 Tax=uncultured Flavonifractor sp. TaxID=1193534 RepID=UPI00266F764E|nr:hypothetical protein [uncultured Flavonifractor sp.]